MFWLDGWLAGWMAGWLDGCSLGVFMPCFAVADLSVSFWGDGAVVVFWMSFPAQQQSSALSSFSFLFFFPPSLSPSFASFFVLFTYVYCFGGGAAFSGGRADFNLDDVTAITKMAAAMGSSSFVLSAALPAAQVWMVVEARSLCGQGETCVCTL